MSLRRIAFIIILSVFSLLSCNNESPTTKPKTKITGPLFSSLPPSQTQVFFKNEVKESIHFNFIKYAYIYNGGGVAIGDINNDGLKDLYFSSNQSTNKLYLNKGNFKFEDITAKAGVSDNKGWTNGVSMIDINNDGLLDIYVCKSASINNPELQRNKLYINQGNNSFKELARNYGLDDMAYSTQAYFLDYDKDGDNDMYLVNHRVDFENNIIINTNNSSKTSSLTTDKLYRNDGNKFTDITQEAGLLNNTWGLSASISDFNEDGWLDIYVCNDFIHGDQLWINNQKGGFENKILDIMDHTSFFSMGSDVADFNNDRKNDLIVLDMVSEDHVANKKNMAAMSTTQFHQLVALGHHHQYMSNMLQMNRGNGVFSDIALSAGVANTDWSWAPLIADFDNDGMKDIFVTNGIKRDMTDNDYKIALDKRAAQGKLTLDDLFALIPSRKIKNYVYQNSGKGAFNKKTDDWGLTQYLNSNGAAYADLDNDGDLDLVTNNLDDYASIYENNSSNNFIKVKLEGPSTNPLGIGAKVSLKSNLGVQYNEYFLNRGFLSSVGEDIIFGINDNEDAGSLTVEWFDGRANVLQNVKLNSTITVKYADASIQNLSTDTTKSLLNEQVSPIINFTHEENEYDDFQNEILLPHKYSTLGPVIAKADINGDNLEDIFVGGAKGQACALFIQTKDGAFQKKNISVFNSIKASETTGAAFFDSDNDGDKDLYIVNGGNERDANEKYYRDRFFVNDGKGNFIASNKIPNTQTSGKAIAHADYDNDGDIDLFIGGRVKPGQYPLPAASTLLENNNGQFKDITESIPDMKELGLVTDAVFTDYDNDNDLDLLVVGEWMALTIFVNEGNKFSKKTLDDITGVGWWYSINASDLDKDGDMDFILGNLGLNNKFGAKKDKPFHVFCNDFDDSGNLDIVLSKENKGKFLPVRGRECSSQQMPFIKEKFPTFKSFAEADLNTIYGGDKLSDALHYTANNFNSLILINDGQGQFKAENLPFEAQIGPTLSTEIIDLNGDGHLDIVGAGNIYNSEVETLRYDASKGYVLLGNGKGQFEFSENSGFLLDGNVKDLEVIQIGNTTNILAAKNNGPIKIFKLNTF